MSAEYLKLLNNRAEWEAKGQGIAEDEGPN
jgi:hypothetical protein